MESPDKMNATDAQRYERTSQYSPRVHYAIEQLDVKKVLGLSLAEFNTWKKEVLESGQVIERSHKGAKIYMEPLPEKEGEVQCFVGGFAGDGSDIEEVAQQTHMGFLKPLEVKSADKGKEDE